MPTRLNDFTYEWNHVCIGGTIEAVAYAFLKDLPILVNSPKPPQPWLKEERRFYDHALYVMSLQGLVPLAGKIVAIRVDGSNLKITTRRQDIIRARFDRAFIFDTEHVSGLPEPTERIDRKLEVIDWFKLRNVKFKDGTIIHNDDDFAHIIHLYKGNEIYSTKHAIVESWMTYGEINDPEYSDTMIRFKLIQDMKEAGFRRFGAESIKRDVRRLGMHKYKSTPKLKFIRNSLKTIKRRNPAVGKAAALMARLDGIH